MPRKYKKNTPQVYTNFRVFEVFWGVFEGIFRGVSFCMLGVFLNFWTLLFCSWSRLEPFFLGRGCDEAPFSEKKKGF